MRLRHFINNASQNWMRLRLTIASFTSNFQLPSTPPWRLHRTQQAVDSLSRFFYLFTFWSLLVEGNRSAGAERLIAMVGTARPVFVLFGSSIVQFSFSNDGWGATLADIYARKADVLLRGYSGWNSRRALQVLDQVFSKDAAVQPSLVILYFGGNDSMGSHSSGLGPHVPLPEYVENMRKIIDHVKSLSDTTRIIVLTCPPVNEEKVNQITSTYFTKLERTNKACQRYSEALVDLCLEMDVKVIDLFTAVQKRREWMTTCFTDGIHLSAEGSKIVVEEILKVLNQAEWKPSLHWKSLPTEFAEDSPYDVVGFDGKSTMNIAEWTFHRDIQWN